MKNLTRYVLYILFLVIINLSTLNQGSTEIKNRIYISGMYGVGLPEKFDYCDPDGELSIQYPSNARTLRMSLGYGITNTNIIEFSYNRFDNIMYDNEIIHADVNGHFTINDTQLINSTLALLSIRHSMQGFRNITPYVYAGIGTSNIVAGDFIHSARQKREVQYIQQNNKEFAIECGGGISYSINDSVDIDILKYGYSKLGASMSIDPQDHDNIASTELKIHSFSSGVTLKF